MTPSELVRAAILEGNTSVAAIAKETGLGQGTVQVILEHFERSGALIRETMTSCPTSGCGSCGQATGCSGATGNRGPVLLKLTKPGTL